VTFLAPFPDFAATRALEPVVALRAAFLTFLAGFLATLGAFLTGLATLAALAVFLGAFPADLAAFLVAFLVVFLVVFLATLADRFGAVAFLTALVRDAFFLEASASTAPIAERIR
jgi:hypothetical protein